MTTFALVHGAHHGARSWDYFIPELRARGHDAVAMDLPIEDPTAGLARYTDAVVDAIADRDSDVVVIGHSMGGLVAPLVAERRPVKRMIFLAAVIPQPGRPFAEQIAGDPRFSPGKRIDHGDGTDSRPPDEAKRRYYHDVDPESTRFALRHLRRQARKPRLEPSPLKQWPAVPSSYIVCAEDRALDPSWCREQARTLLGVEPIELPGSHSPFLARPAELADVVVSLV